MPSDKFQDTFNDYIKKARDGEWLHLHAVDSRNSDRVKVKIQLDTDSRECLAYLKELTLMVNGIRMDNNLEVIS